MNFLHQELDVGPEDVVAALPLELEVGEQEKSAAFVGLAAGLFVLAGVGLTTRRRA